MSKYRYRVFLPILILFAAAMLFSGCGQTLYKVSYLNGTKEVDSTSIAKGSKIPSSEIIPVRDGYEFSGWYYDDATFENKLGSEDKIEADTNLYAKFITDEEFNKDGYTVTFVTNGGSEIAPTKYLKIKSMPISKKHSSSLVGWYTSPEFAETTKISYPFKVEDNMTLYAKWENYVGVLYTLLPGNTAYAVTAYSGDDSSIDILSKYNGKDVIKIADRAFENMTDLTQVTIPDSVTVIGSSAFYGCSGLKRVNSNTDGEFVLPAKLTSVGEGAFYGCNLMGSISLPFVGGVQNPSDLNHKSVFGYIFGYQKTSSAEQVSGYTYQYNSQGVFYHYAIPSLLTKVKVTAATEIGFNSFYNCKNIEEITLAGDVVEIRANAFNGSGLKALTLKVAKPPYLGAGAFSNTSQDLKIYVPSGAVEVFKASNSSFYSLSDRIFAEQ